MPPPAPRSRPDTSTRLWPPHILERVTEARILADYDNVKAGASRETRRDECRTSLTRLISYLSDAFGHIGLRPKRSILDLYGGWLHEDGNGSFEAQNLGAVLHEFRTSKIAGGRVSVDLKRSLESTRTESRSAPLIGTRFRNKQKMVDAMLVLDTYSICQTCSPTTAVIIVSHDVDLLPGLIACAQAECLAVPKFLLRLLRRMNDDRQGTFPQDAMLAQIAEVYHAHR